VSDQPRGAATSIDGVVERISGAGSPAAAFALLADALRARGLDQVCFSLVTDHTALGQRRQFALLGTLPGEWVERYRAAGLLQLDPLWRRLYEADHAVEHPLSAGGAATAAERGALAAWREVAVHDLLVVPLRSSGGALAALVATRRDDVGCDARELSALTLLALHFYERYVELCAAPPPEGITLSDAERHVLTWSARGKTKKEIAIVLGTSPHTVDYYQRKLLKKLEVSSVAAAVARAIALRLLLQ
jgi:LuxR family transcriptional regulator, quorum-sensing system regulator BjaR1